jgi:hypothetical protein
MSYKNALLLVKTVLPYGMKGLYFLMLPHGCHAVESWCCEHYFDTCGDVSQF